MTKTWIPAIFDRTYGDVQSAQRDPDQSNPKGCWNAVDLNRIENNTAYVAEYMLEQRIVHTPPAIIGPSFEAWTADMIPTKAEIDRIINNVKLLITLSSTNPAIAYQLPTIYAATQINYVLANQIEYALELMHTQPRLPLEYWRVKINNGIITTIVRTDGTIETVNTSEALVAEDEVVTIRGVEYGEDASSQQFTYWSGNASDVGLLDNYQSKQTYFIMPYRDVELTANFETHIPRTLNLTNGYISEQGDPTAESGPTSGTFFAGDQIMIIADIAPSGKAFYEWTGTQAGLDNLVGSTDTEDPSTCILTMPDCDVQLAPHYINAGQHYVSVTNGHSYGPNGNNSGWYNYNEQITIVADVPTHYGFDNWSGSTSYLQDIYSSSQTFAMPDENVSFRAEYSYRYSYNDVQIINGLITVNGSNVNRASGLRENSSYPLVPTPPDASQDIDYWSIEGYGSVSGNTFYVGDGNAIITGHYNYIRRLTVINKNNAGGTLNYTAVQGHNWGTITTNYEASGRYFFKEWQENGQRISTSLSITLTAGTEDRTITAVYEYVEPPPPPTYYTVTQINKNNDGNETTTSYVSGSYVTVSSNDEAHDQLLEGIYKDGTKVASSTSYNFYIYSDTTIEFRYRNKEYYTLTVQNGYITDTGTTSETYLERTSVSVTADTPPAGQYFSYWSTVSGSLYSYPSGATGIAIIGRSDATIKAVYASPTPIRQITVITNSGTNTYNVTQGYSQNIYSGTPPESYEFNHWEVVSGDADIANLYSSSTSITARLQDSTIRAVYTLIPSFTVNMINGYVWDGNNWVTNATLLRNSTNAIKMKPAPTGHQFLQWNVYVNGVLQTDANDIVAPLAEQTRLRNLTRNLTIEATYYIPDTEIKYILTIERKDGTSEQYSYAAGTDIPIRASAPDTGMEFYKWTGDTAYIAGGVYAENSYVHMPTQNIQIKENYVPEGYIPQYDLDMTNLYGQCCYTTSYTNPETGTTTTTDHWVSRYSYPEGTTVRIRTTPIPNEYYFSMWTAKNHDTQESATALIQNINLQETTLIMPDFDLDVEPVITLKTTYPLIVNDGGTSGAYYEGARADIYFGKVNTDDVHYQFIRWTGANVSQLELYDGGMFNVLTPGDINSPQYIKMPARATEVTPTYKTLYRLTINNGTIDTTGEHSGYYENNTTLAITANPPEQGMKFLYWIGDVSALSSAYDPTPTVTTVIGTTSVTAVYSSDSEQNGIGYVLTDLKNTSTINNVDVTIIAGTINIGFIVTDTNGHIYTITDTNSTTSTIYRLTKIIRGGDQYE